jgi:hypothetical protein
MGWIKELAYTENYELNRKSPPKNQEVSPRGDLGNVRPTIEKA